MRELRSLYLGLAVDEIHAEFKRAIARNSKRVLDRLKSFGGSLDEAPAPQFGATTANKAYIALQEMAREADRVGHRMRASAIRDALDDIDTLAARDLQALCTKHGIAETPFTRTMPRPPATIGPTVTAAAIPPPPHTSIQSGWVHAFTQVRALSHHFSAIHRDSAYWDFRRTADRMAQSVMRKFRKLVGNPSHLIPLSSSVSKPELAFLTIENMARQAAESGAALRAYECRQALEAINKYATGALDELTRKYGALDALSTQATHGARPTQATQAPQAMQATQAMRLPSVTVPSTTVPPVVQLELPVPAHPNALVVNPAVPEPVGGLVHATDVPDPHPASGLPGPSLAEAAGARAGDLGRSRLDPPATVSGATAADPVATETIVTPSLGETSSFWLQPVDPVSAPGSVAFDSGLHHAHVAVQPPPLTTTAPSRTAPALSPALRSPSRRG